jgi:hypothetical protein
VRRFLPRRPSAGIVVACIALFVALTSTSYADIAQLARNSVGTPQLRNNAVTTPKIRNNTVTTPKIRNNTVTTPKIRNNAVTLAKLAPNARIPGPAGPAGPAGAAGPAGPAGPSDAYARFLNGPVAVPAALTTLANLTIPQAGNYVIFGKAYFTSTANGVVSCRLVAGTNFDESQTFVQPNFPFTIALNVVNNFAAPGSVDFACSATGTQQARFIKISAIRVANLANSG